MEKATVSTSSPSNRTGKQQGIGTIAVVCIYACGIASYLATALLLHRYCKKPQLLPTMIFLTLFWFRYFRLVVHVFAWAYAAPISVLEFPSLHASDASVIVPTVDPGDPNFVECITSICSNLPAVVIIVTPTKKLRLLAKRICFKIGRQYGVRT